MLEMWQTWKKGSAKGSSSCWKKGSSASSPGGCGLPPPSESSELLLTLWRPLACAASFFSLLPRTD